MSPDQIALMQSLWTHLELLARDGTAESVHRARRQHATQRYLANVINVIMSLAPGTGEGTAQEVHERREKVYRDE